MNRNLKVLSAALAAGVIAGSALLLRAQADDHDHDDTPTTGPADAAKVAPHGRGAAGHADEHEHGEHADEVKLSPEAVARYGIKTAPVERRVLAETITVPARVAFNADAVAHIGSAVKGRAVEIKFHLGDRVNQSDPLAVVESPELGQAQSDLLQKRTGVAVAECAVGPARNAAERARKLYEENQGIAFGDVQKREADANAAEGAAQAARAAMKAAEDTLRLLGMTPLAIKTICDTGNLDPRHIIGAPIGGQVIARDVTPGELVGPEKDALLVLADTSTLWVVADVPESRLRDVRIGSDATIEIAAASDTPVRGRVSLVAPALDAATRTASVRVEVPNPDGLLRPGMFATARIASAAAAGGRAVLTVPDEAVQTVENAPAVFVPVDGEAGTFAKRPVTVGPSIDGVRRVTAGLKEGEPVVVVGSFVLKAELGKSEAAHEH